MRLRKWTVENNEGTTILRLTTNPESGREIAYAKLCHKIIADLRPFVKLVRGEVEER